MARDRVFTVVESSVHRHGGRYVADTPSQAARHAAKIQFRFSRGPRVTFTLREIGNNRREYRYVATRKERDDEVTWTVHDGEMNERRIVSTHEITVRSQSS